MPRSHARGKWPFPVSPVDACTRSPAGRRLLSYHRAVVSRLARPAFLVPLVIVLVLIGLGAWWWSRAGSSTPVSQAEAGEDYGGGADATAIPDGPRAGVWSYRATGNETVGVGPVSIDRPLPSTAQVVVRPAAGGFWRTLALSKEHVEASRLRLSPEGEYLVERVTTVKVAGLGRDDRQVLVPPPLVYPSAMEVGDAWQERYRMDEVRVSGTARVLRRAVVDVGGTPVRALVVDKKATITGPVSGFRRDTVWWSPDLHMPVRLVMATKVGGVASLRTDVTIVLTSTEPQR